MTKSREALAGCLKLAGALLIVSGILHGFNWIVSGWNPDSRNLVYFGVLYLVLGAFLRLGVPKIRYLAILSVMMGGIGAYIMLHVFAVPESLTEVLIAFDAAIFVLLFASIWRGRVSAPT